MRILKVLAVVVGILLLLVSGLFVWSGGKLFSLEYIDFPKGELEKLIKAEPPEAKPTISGPLTVEVGSQWTWWAMKIFPGTFLIDAKINNHQVSLVVDTGASQTVSAHE